MAPLNQIFTFIVYLVGIVIALAVLFAVLRALGVAV